MTPSTGVLVDGPGDGPGPSSPPVSVVVGRDGERIGRGEVCSGDSEQRCACRRARARHEMLSCHWVK